MGIKQIITGVMFLLIIGMTGLLAYNIKNSPKAGKIFGKDQPQNNWQWKDQWDVPKTAPVDPPAKTPPTSDAQVTAVSYSEALQKSGELGKPVLVFFTAEWCQWCKKMKAETMVDANVQSVLKNYILVYEDADKSREAANKFGVDSLPSFVVTNYKQDKLKMDAGFKTADVFSTWLSDSSLFNQPKQSAPQASPAQPKKEPKQRRFFRDRNSPPQPGNPG